MFQQVTDGLWMDNSKHAIYTTSLRTMHFYDASASVHYEEYRAFGFRSKVFAVTICASLPRVTTAYLSILLFFHYVLVSNMGIMTRRIRTNDVTISSWKMTDVPFLETTNFVFQLNYLKSFPLGSRNKVTTG